MRVCLVGLDYAPYRSSGLAMAGELLAQGLRDGGCQVTVISSRRQDLPREEMTDGIRVIRVAIGRSNWIGFAHRAAQAVRELQEQAPFDIVHFLDVHFAYAFQGRYLAWLLQSFRQRLRAAGGLPYHSSLANLLGRYLYYTAARTFLEKRAVKRAGALIAVSNAAKEEYLVHYGVQPKRVQVIHLGIDTRVFRPQKARAQELRHRLGLEGTSVLLYVGFSTPRKGLEYLAEALKYLPKDVKLVIIGRWEAGYRRRFLRALRGAEGRVLELGYVPDEEMPAYYSMADVFVLPSLLEGFGLPLVEAMACGLPVAAAASGSIPEVVGGAGILVPPRESAALAQAVSRVLRDTSLRRRLRRAGKQNVETRFTRDRMVAETLEFYANFASG